jgi:N-acyl-D-aspartate/D-glutamate deacylase
VAGRPVGVILGHNTSMNPFSFRPAYRALDGLPAAERWARLRDPAVRAAILAEPPSEAELNRQGQFIRFVATRWDRMFAMGDPPDYEPTADQSIAAIAARTNHTPDEIAYDYLTEASDRFLFFPVVGYVHGDHEQIRELLLDPATLLGLSDGGAHVGQIVDAGLPSYMLSHWGRDRQRGPGMPLEQLVKMQTSETADFFGFRDRGRLKAGLRADLNLIDFDKLRLHQPEIVHDLPTGARRLVQRVDGYRATLVAGVPIFEHGQDTGARPGRLVRAGR